MKVSKLAHNLIGSEILKIAGEVNELIRKGAKVSNLTVGDFNPKLYPIPEALQGLITEAYKDHQTNYPPSDGVLELRESVSKFLAHRSGLNYSHSQILIAGGSRPIIYSTYLAIVDPGDKVIYPAPSWNNNHYCYLTGAKDCAIATRPESRFMPTAADIKPHVKGAVLLALCSPLNPTGTMFSKKDLMEICELVLEENKSRSADEKPLYIMYDQIYWLLTYSGHEHFDPVSLYPELKDYVIYVDGISKYFNSTGVRVGWGFGPEHIINRMKSILGHVGAWAPKAEQVAVAKFLPIETEVNLFLRKNAETLHASLEALYQGVKTLNSEGFDIDAVEPMGAIYLTIKVNYLGKKTPEGQPLDNTMDINSYLIREAQVALVPFNAFGTDSSFPWFRASVGACSLADINAAIPRLREALKKLS